MFKTFGSDQYFLREPICLQEVRILQDFIFWEKNNTVELQRRPALTASLIVVCTIIMVISRWTTFFILLKKFVFLQVFDKNSFYTFFVLSQTTQPLKLTPVERLLKTLSSQHSERSSTTLKFSAAKEVLKNAFFVWVF